MVEFGSYLLAMALRNFIKYTIFHFNLLNIFKLVGSLHFLSQIVQETLRLVEIFTRKAKIVKLK